MGSFREKWKNRILMKMPTSWTIFLFYSMLFHHIPSSTSSKGKKPSNSSPHQVSDVQASSFGLWVGLSIPFFEISGFRQVRVWQNLLQTGCWANIKLSGVFISDVQASSFGLWVGLSIPFFEISGFRQVRQNLLQTGCWAGICT